MKTMLNFRKLKQDFSPAIVKTGKELYKRSAILSAKILHMNSQSVRISATIEGKFETNYESLIELNIEESEIMDSNCDCNYQYDCQHLAALLFYIEDHYDEIVVDYSQDANLETGNELDEQEKEQLREVFSEAITKETQRRDGEYQKQALSEYLSTSYMLTRSPFFMPKEKLTEDKAEISIILTKQDRADGDSRTTLHPEIQFALRIPGRSKPLHIPSASEFLDAIRYQEPMYISGRRYFFSQQSFSEESYTLLRLLVNQLASRGDTDPQQRYGKLDIDIFGNLLAKAHEFALHRLEHHVAARGSLNPLPFLYYNSIEEPMLFALAPCKLAIDIDYIETPAPKLLLKPTIILDDHRIQPEEALLLECATPGMIYKHVYYRFPEQIKRMHLRQLPLLQEITIPEALFGTFVENALPELQNFATIGKLHNIDRFVTMPFVDNLRAICNIQYTDNELEAELFFIYGDITIPASPLLFNYNDMTKFMKGSGILARNLIEERQLIQQVFQDFYTDPKTGHFHAKTEKKIVEFMTEIVPQFRDRVEFNYPSTLLDRFIYEESRFFIHLEESPSFDSYVAVMTIEGHLKNIHVDALWECLATRRSYLEVSDMRFNKSQKKNSDTTDSFYYDNGQKKILVLDLEKIATLVEIFEELGISTLEDCRETRPLWSLASLDKEAIENSPIILTFSPKIEELYQQMLGKKEIETSALPVSINASLRSYQIEGVQWLERLRKMHLNGILADDMGLGKTLQTIVAITQYHEEYESKYPKLRRGVAPTNTPPLISLIVAPTSLIYNWKEEFSKFNPKLQVLVVDGSPSARKKRLDHYLNYDIIITSYGLLQKDIDIYKEISFAYAILDEAQHIKNRGTRNAKSAKMVQALYRVILTGTPIENSLEDLWSLFDFLMPGLLGTYERFGEKYIRANTPTATPVNKPVVLEAATLEEKEATAPIPGPSPIEILRKKTAPFVLRRMKKDVLKELPPISEMVYYCNLTETQQKLYHSYALSARQELENLVKKEGFSKLHIHVLATLTRLKQICCHPAIFAKEEVTAGDSAKYELMFDMLTTLIEGNHRIVIFSQYTRMLKIIRDDLTQMGIKFSYLDGTTKDRLEIVNQFNQDATIPVFLVSLKAGGTGLNLVGADTVIHYDMWWNPATESQATGRVYRFGQNHAVSSYKLVTLGTIEEKILHLQMKKRDLMEQVIHDDDEIISKLSWEEVLELLQT